MTETKESPGSVTGATGADKHGKSLVSTEYRLRVERATTLCLAIEATDPEEAAPILWEALDSFHRKGLPVSPSENLMGYATEWANYASERELKAYAIAAARRMNPATRESFRLYLGGA